MVFGVFIYNRFFDLRVDTLYGHAISRKNGSFSQNDKDKDDDL